MPTYEYACTTCGNHLEVVQRFSDDPLAICPSCGGRLRKVFGSIGIAFKGSGFYKTDSRALSSQGAGKGRAKKEREGVGSTAGSTDGAASSDGAARAAGAASASSDTASASSDTAKTA